ncbi:cache domain-containing sensor histidine kinase [Cohnella caldifontis]|uniref:cache domain-containing sensor histidine kinase n=1 Tax=Cohnella caldifontis TaxID=3027471 RepID=UPI0023EBF460|nr:sensor histidine kinase [Cohnella sp. YIM B05605]
MKQRMFRLQHRIFFYFSLLFILSTILFGYYAYRANVQTAEENFTSAVSGSMAQSANGLANLFGEAEKQANLFAASHVVRDSLSPEPTTAVGQYDRYVNLERVSDAYEENYSSFGIRIFLDPPRRFMNDGVRYLPVALLDGEDSPRYLFRRNSVLHWSLAAGSENDGNNLYVFSCFRDIRSPDDFGEYRGTVSFDIRSSAVSSLFANAAFPGGGRLFLLDEKGKVIYEPSFAGPVRSSLDKSTMERIQTERRGSLTIDKQLLVYWALDGYPFYLAVDIPMNELSNQSRPIMFNFLLVALLVLIVSFIVTFLISGRVTGQLKRLMQAMATVDSHDFNVKVPVKRMDEIGVLSVKFNWMVERIRALIEDVYKTGVEKKEAELKLLQAQINPHFLYNTLDSVHWLSVKHQAPDIGYMVRNLSAFLRLSLHIGGTSTLGTELRHTRAYFNIQKFRFEDRIELADEVPERLHGIEVLPLILQPLVENAILHGILKYEDRIGKIALFAEEADGMLRLEVTDDGPGIEPARLEEVRHALVSEPYEGESTGLRNVHRRIRFRYGEPYGLTVENRAEGGARLVLTLPAARPRQAESPD